MQDEVLQQVERDEENKTEEKKESEEERPVQL